MNADIILKFSTHIHLGIMKQQLNLQPEICFIYRVNPVLHPDILTHVYNIDSYTMFKYVSIKCNIENCRHTEAEDANEMIFTTKLFPI